MNEILVAGAAGMLGHAVMRTFSRDHRVVGLARSPCTPPEGTRLIIRDLTAPGDLSDLPRTCDPDVIVNCAALTSMEFCERHPALAAAVNRDLPLRLAQAFPRARLAHVSTDAVYAPEVELAREDSPLEPQNVYGRTKLDGERLLLEGSAGSLVLRTTLVGFSPVPGRKLHLADWIVSRLKRGETLPLYTDVRFTPISVWHFARLLAALIDHWPVERLYNLGGGDPMSKFEFGLGLARALGAPEALALPALLRDQASDVRRRYDQSLDSSLFTRTTGLSLPSATDCLRELASRIGETHEYDG